MIERDMEDLIAAYPSDFFPRFSLTLVGRQQSFEGVGRFDLLFFDQHHTTILMELKARPAKYEDADQLARYKDELERRGHRGILMWLVAPLIPPSVRDFLDRIGIQHEEIHEAEFRHVAERRGEAIKSEAAKTAAASAVLANAPQPSRSPKTANALDPASLTTTELAERFGITPKQLRVVLRSMPEYADGVHTRYRWSENDPAIERIEKAVGEAAPRLLDADEGIGQPQVPTGPTVTHPPSLQWTALGFDLLLNNPGAFDHSEFGSRLEAFKAAVPSKRNAGVVRDLRGWAKDPQRDRLPHRVYCSLLRWVTTSGWKAAVPHAEALWRYLFGSPAPTWYTWSQSRRRYEFHAGEWKQWFDSLGEVAARIERTYREHNDKTAWEWPPEKQCQCTDCKAYRAGAGK